MSRINKYFKVSVFDIEEVLSFFKEELRNTPVLRESIIKVLTHLNSKIISKGVKSREEVYIPGAMTFENGKTAYELGMKKSQVKRVKTFLSKYGVVSFYKSISVEHPPGFVNLWFMNVGEFGKVVDASYITGEVLGNSDIYNKDRPWVNLNAYYGVKEGREEYLHLSTFVERSLREISLMEVL